MSESAAVTTTQSAMPVPLQQRITQVLNTVETLLPADIGLDQFKAAVWLQYTQTPALMTECSIESNATCLIKAATYGLLPTRDVHFLPFRAKRGGGKKDATWVPNYQGIQRMLMAVQQIRIVGNYQLGYTQKGKNMPSFIYVWEDTTTGRRIDILNDMKDYQKPPTVEQAMEKGFTEEEARNANWKKIVGSKNVLIETWGMKGNW